MFRMRALLRCGLLGLSLMLGAVPAIAAPVLLISIDGLRPDDVLQAKQRGLSLPNLTRFVTQGSYASGVTGVLPTLTYPSHVTLLTGVTPAVHGVGSNLTFDPLNKNQYGWDWYVSDIRVPTLWAAARAKGLSTANVHWPVSVGAPADWNLPQIWRTGTPDDRKLLAALATPDLLPGLEKDLGPYPLGIDESLDGDVRRTRFAIALLKQHSPAFMTVYLASLDHEEHAKGPGTVDANRVLEQLDVQIGQLVQAAQQVHPDGIVAVVSDHGFASVEHDVNLYAPFIKAGLISVKDGEVTDWQAAIWNDGGSAAIVLKNPDDAALQARVGALLKTLAADPAYGIDNVMDRTNIAKKGGATEASWFVIFKPGFEMGIKPDAPLPAPSHYLGMHGYDPARIDQRATLLIQGKGVAAGRNLGLVDMRDIAPTLAKWLGVSLSQAQGKPLDIKQ
jgi:predicted AlkP superfamily pyrophosphatase or phosphodiesterase